TKSLQDPCRGCQGIFASQLVSLVPEFTGVGCQFAVESDQHPVTIATDQEARLRHRSFDLHRRACYGPGPPRPQRFVLARSPTGEQGLGEFIDRLDSAAGFEEVDDAGTYQVNSRTLGPPDRELGDDLADATTVDLQSLGYLRLAGPRRRDCRVET